MYVAVKGGERAIDNAHAWLAEERRGDPGVAELSVAQIREQLTLAVNRVMAEGSLFDADLAALAIKQARGDLVEAIFTNPRLSHHSAAPGGIAPGGYGGDGINPADFGDVQGCRVGQVLGPTFDYTHRLLDFKLAAESEGTQAATAPATMAAVPHVMAMLDRDGMIASEPVGDAVAPDPPRRWNCRPGARCVCKPSRAATRGFILSMTYSTQRGYGRTYAFVGELRIGAVAVEMDIPELGFAVEIGEIDVTECETVNQFKGSKTEPAQFTRGYGLVFGQTERKAVRQVWWTGRCAGRNWARTTAVPRRRTGNSC